MTWWGKVVGGAVGFMIGGPLGALLWASFGHVIDRSLSGKSSPQGSDQERIQTAFFTATFAVMGYIAKADGHVTREEISLAEQLMRHFRLDQRQQKLARALFNQGKQNDFQFVEIVEQFRSECHRRRDLIKMFVEIQIQAALADGKIVVEENRALQQLAQILGLTAAELERLVNLIRGAARGDDGGDVSLADAYRILGVQADAPLAEIRKAYRRLRSQHHPDKLVSKGLPEEMMKLANEKTHEIQSAWEQIKQARGQ